MRLLFTCLIGCFLLTSCAQPPPASETISIRIHQSKFISEVVSAPVGVPVTFVIENQDPIDHEFIVGDTRAHDRHRKGTHPAHGEVPGEVTVEAESMATTTFVFTGPGKWVFACHLPGHFKYGMHGHVNVLS